MNQHMEKQMGTHARDIIGCDMNTTIDFILFDYFKNIPYKGLYFSFGIWEKSRERK